MIIMSLNDLNDTVNFDLPKNPQAIIKVIGVGGGGGNAVNHMYQSGIKGVDFAVCNTDSQALISSPVPKKVQLGMNLTEGLGAGANPEVGQEAAIESIKEIRNVLDDNTKMVFITAGMGGGTGTGAAPVIAGIAKEMGILTVGIVTTPFNFEGASRLKQAQEGIEAMRQNTDSLIIINNNKLREVFGNLGFRAGFSKADEVVAIAARGIAEVITHNFSINIDLRDAKTVLSNSGTAIMGSGKSSGENRAKDAILKALDSPLLNDNHILGAKNVLLLIVSGKDEITIDEIGEINDHIQTEAGGHANIIMGVGEDQSLDAEIAVTVIATGFSRDNAAPLVPKAEKKKVYSLIDDVNKPYVATEATQPKEEPKAETTKKPQVITKSLFEIEETPQKEELKAETPEIRPSVETPSEPKQEPTNEWLNEAETNKDLSNPDEGGIKFQLEDAEDIRIEDLLKNQVEPEQELSVEFDFEIEPSFTEEVTLEEDVMVQAQEPETTKYQLELDEPEYMPVSKKPEVEEQDEVFNFEIKAAKEETPKVEAKKIEENEDPFDRPLSETLAMKNDKRREQLKGFNYRFKNNLNNIDELISTPAYARQNIQIDSNEKYSKSERMSRMTIEGEGKDLDIKGNNSFLHDNVD